MTVPLAELTPLAGGYTLGVTVGWYTFPDVNAHKSDPYSHVVLFHQDRAELDTLASYHVGTGRWDSPGRLGGTVHTPFGISGASAALGDSMVVLADGIAGTLTLFRFADGSLSADTVDLGIRARLVSDRDLSDLEARLREEKPDLPRRLEFETPQGWSVATSLVVGEGREFWLRPAVEGDQEAHWIVVRLGAAAGSGSPGSPGALEMWRVILPRGFGLRTVWGGRLYGVVKDELDVQSVGAVVNPVGATLVPELG